MKQQFTISSEHGKRLDVLLHEKFSSLSRNHLQQLVKRRHIHVNGKSERPAYRVETGDVISVDIDDAEYHQELQPHATVEFQVLAETPDYVVVDKPAGLLMHPERVGEESTLVHGLIARYPEIAQVGEDPMRPGIVHRLDRLASGIVVVARTQAMFESLKQQWKQRTVIKEYAALVHGHMPETAGRIHTYIRRSTRNHLKMVSERTPSLGAKEAISEYTVMREWPDFQLLQVRILTGRTHQIRLHLSSLGHPIVGDRLYALNTTRVREIGRLFLHAQRLVFQDLAGEVVEYTSELPGELERILTEMKG